ncbi:MAG: Holliday junction resolvase RecU [Nitrososphaera sp.]|nr:Holliday junction resolvase RecU [Nitrososphaera sp.]
MTPEGKVKAEIKAALKALGPNCHFFMPVQTGYGQRAVDFIGCYKGRYFAIEAKRADGKGRLTAIQKKFLSDVDKAGGIAIVAASWEDVGRVFNHEFTAIESSEAVELNDVIQIRKLATDLFALADELKSMDGEWLAVYYKQNRLKQIEETAKALRTLWLIYGKDAE